MLPASIQTIRNTIPNNAKKEMKKLIGIPPLRFHEFQWDVNYGKKGTELESVQITEEYLLSFHLLNLRHRHPTRDVTGATGDHFAKF